MTSNLIGILCTRQIVNRIIYFFIDILNFLWIIDWRLFRLWCEFILSWVDHFCITRWNFSLHLSSSQVIKNKLFKCLINDKYALFVYSVFGISITLSSVFYLFVILSVRTMHISYSTLNVVRLFEGLTMVYIHRILIYW